MIASRNKKPDRQKIAKNSQTYTLFPHINLPFRIIFLLVVAIERSNIHTVQNFECHRAFAPTPTNANATNVVVVSDGRAVPAKTYLINCLFLSLKKNTIGFY
jgi:hypothetical protein